MGISAADPSTVNTQQIYLNEIEDVYIMASFGGGGSGCEWCGE